MLCDDVWAAGQAGYKLIEMTKPTTTCRPGSQRVRGRPPAENRSAEEKKEADLASIILKGLLNKTKVFIPLAPR